LKDSERAKEKNQVRTKPNVNKQDTCNVDVTTGKVTVNKTREMAKTKQSTHAKEINIQQSRKQEEKLKENRKKK